MFLFEERERVCLRNYLLSLYFQMYSMMGGGALNVVRAPPLSDGFCLQMKNSKKAPTMVMRTKATDFILLSRWMINCSFFGVEPLILLMCFRSQKIPLTCLDKSLKLYFSGRELLSSTGWTDPAEGSEAVIDDGDDQQLELEDLSSTSSSKTEG